MARALGLEQAEVGSMLDWYDGIVTAVTEITAGADPPSVGLEAFSALRDRLEAAIAGDPEASLLAAAASRATLDTGQVVSNAGVLLFGGVETTEGMIANAVLYLLEWPDALAAVRRDPGTTRRGDRGVATARAGGGGRRPVRHRRCRARRRADRAR